MKKLLVWILIVTASTTQCDNLLNAIRKHDLEKVTLLLQQKEYAPTNYSQYITAAHKAVERCHNDVQLQSLKSGMGTLLSAAGTAAIVASFHSLYHMYDKSIDYQLTGKQIDDLKFDIATFVGWNFLAGLLFGLAIVIRDNEIETAYNEAVKIQQLILELSYR